MGAVLSMRGGFPQPPEHLGEAGKRAWNSGLDLWREGAIQSRDLEAWKLYCEAWDEKAECEKLCAEEGKFQKVSGCYVPHGALKLRLSIEQKIMGYFKLFGLVPDARKKRPAVQQGVASRKK